MNKKQLYENIMRNVSYEIKKVLNEDIIDINTNDKSEVTDYKVNLLRYDKLNRQEKLAAHLAFNNFNDIAAITLMDTEDVASSVMDDNHISSKIWMIGLTKNDGIYMSQLYEDNEKIKALLNEKGYNNLNDYERKHTDNEYINFLKSAYKIDRYHIKNIKFNTDFNNIRIEVETIDNANKYDFEYMAMSNSFVGVLNRLFKKDFDIYKTKVDIIQK